MAKTVKPAAGRKLTHKERRKIETVIKATKGDGKPHSAQDSIPFEVMCLNGLCRLDGKTWSKCIEFEDVNYQLANANDKTAVFENLCDFYNYYDASIGIQLSLISRYANKEDFQKTIEIPPQGDDFDGVRAEYTAMLRGQLARGNNGLVKTKFLTLTIEADNIQAARGRLARIEADTLNQFKVMGAPPSFRLGDSRIFRMGKKLGAVSFLQILAPELNDRMLADFMEADGGIMVNLHIRGIDQNEAIKTIRRKITDLDSMKITEQKKAVRSGYDIDILPPDLITFSKDVAALLADLQSRNERMFLLTFIILNTANTRQRLENDIFTVSGIAQKHNCTLRRLDFQQEQGVMSSLPLGYNAIEIQRGMTTSSTAIFVPFMTRELRMDGQALYYGMNALSHNVIMADRKRLKSAKGLHCKGGYSNRNLQAGKPFAAQMDGHPQERNGNTSGTEIKEYQHRRKNLHPHMTYLIAGKFFQKLSEKSSVLPPFFLLLVEGSNLIPPISDYTIKTQKGAQELLSKPVYQSYRKLKRGIVQCGRRKAAGLITVKTSLCA